MRLIAPFLALSSVSALALESTKTLPKGVRSATIRNVNTQISEKTNGANEARPLAKPLNKELTFKDIAKGEKGLKQQQLIGFLLAEDFSMNDAAGQFTAELKGRVHVVAPIFALGLTDKMTVAAAVPYYQAQTNIAVGFQKNSNGQRFLDALADPYHNQISSGREAGEKLNNAVGRLNTKLEDNGFRTLKDWENHGLGDVTLLVKHKIVDVESVKVTYTAGTVLGTGAIPGPDVLTGIPFGDAQSDLFFGPIADIPMGPHFTLNAYGKYTNQLPGTRTIRLVTEDETIEVSKERVNFKLGDKIDAGTAVIFENTVGLSAGLGYNYSRKFSDLYKTQQETKNVIEKNTDAFLHQAEVEIGFSGVPAFRKKQVPIPFDTKLSYKHHLLSRNTAIQAGMLQLDLGIFF